MVCSKAAIWNSMNEGFKFIIHFPCPCLSIPSPNRSILQLSVAETAVKDILWASLSRCSLPKHRLVSLVPDQQGLLKRTTKAHENDALLGSELCWWVDFPSWTVSDTLKIVHNHISMNPVYVKVKTTAFGYCLERQNSLPASYSPLTLMNESLLSNVNALHWPKKCVVFACPFKMFSTLIPLAVKWHWKIVW